MRKYIILLALLFASTNIWAQNQEYEVRRLEVELNFGMGRGFASALEARVNINPHWDVGLRGSMGSEGTAMGVVSDYNFVRPNKNVLFFVGAGLGWGEHEKSGFADGSTRITDQFNFIPRAGVELFQHLRLTLNVSTYNFKAVHPMMVIGVVFGGGRKDK